MWDRLIETPYRNRGHGLDRGLIKRTKSTKRSRFACQGRFSTRGHNSTFGKPPSRSPGTLSYFWHRYLIDLFIAENVEDSNRPELYIFTSTRHQEQGTRRTLNRRS
ncbi:hypothetical protein HZU73_04420 [Apis mellifera caucasica]|uniref:Uncharacterized protein LOC113218650 n=1 Tax=Apis mellifera TaxID=7460 RepID=A0A7M7MG88_APIME|nr:uncharacterized protein LOC113218650 [Apis mellifera]KAG6800140.1 hypothetical protein HZU73_04420 [Apis mellifera caucasica]KAG9433152.1 hypothetical protein HZU67_05120 [Apis mellifera carnica]|eukprot:XP_026295464.1 uncharacterized protein LOC113218650 [Apis mellifera]